MCVEIGFSQMTLDMLYKLSVFLFSVSKDSHHTRNRGHWDDLTVVLGCWYSFGSPQLLLPVYTP